MWFSNLSPFEIYLVALPAVMFGSILFLAGIILLLEPRNKNDAQTLEAIRKALEKAGAKLSADRNRQKALISLEPGKVRTGKESPDRGERGRALVRSVVGVLGAADAISNDLTAS